MPGQHRRKLVVIYIQQDEFFERDRLAAQQLHAAFAGAKYFGQVGAECGVGFAVLSGGVQAHGYGTVGTHEQLVGTAAGFGFKV